MKIYVLDMNHCNLCQIYSDQLILVANLFYKIIILINYALLYLGLSQQESHRSSSEHGQKDSAHVCFGHMSIIQLAIRKKTTKLTDKIIIKKNNNNKIKTIDI